MSSVNGPFDDAVLLTKALGLGPTQAKQIQPIIEALGGLRGLYWAGSEPFEPALSAYMRRRLEALISVVQRMIMPDTRCRRIDSAEDVVRYLGPSLILEKQETFWNVALDARGRVIVADQVAKGTLTACLVHPREVFAAAIRVRAASVIVAHNHPSGDPEPSPEDLELTRRLSSAGDLLGIPLVDHIIIARDGYRSLGHPRPNSRAPQRSAGLAASISPTEA